MFLQNAYTIYKAKCIKNMLKDDVFNFRSAWSTLSGNKLTRNKSALSRRPVGRASRRKLLNWGILFKRIFPFYYLFSNIKKKIWELKTNVKQTTAGSSRKKWKVQIRHINRLSAEKTESIAFPMNILSIIMSKNTKRKANGLTLGCTQISSTNFIQILSRNLHSFLKNRCVE